MFRTVTFLLILGALPARAATTVTILHFADYHSHVLPFYSEGTLRGGLARAIGFMKRHKEHGALVFNGGDMMNKGAPAWSDRYRCAEWPWLNGIVDAMAFGNHDADYGNEELERCRSEVRYPILSANTAGFERYHVFVRDGVRIGVFAVAGSDFPKLVTNAKLTFTDPVAAARDVVDVLRKREHVDAVVMLGHEHAGDDYKLAAAVPGIDLILGSHSHLKRELTRIAGSNTWFISPFQYLTCISVVDLTFKRHKLAGVSGRLVPVDAAMAADPQIAERVASMQRELESDPQYRNLFVPVAKLPQPMEVQELASLTVDVMRDAAHSDMAMASASSFRQPLPAGPIDLETLRAALPYDNEIVVVKVSGSQLEDLLRRAEADVTSDARAYSTPAPQAIAHSRLYSVAVTDYMTRVSDAYRDIFSAAAQSGLGAHVRTEVARRLGARFPPPP